MRVPTDLLKTNNLLMKEGLRTTIISVKVIIVAFIVQHSLTAANPRACCGTLTHTLPVECAGNDNSTLGNDVFYTFTLEKHCDLWPTLQINTNNSDFDVVTKVEYEGTNGWFELPYNSTNLWNKAHNDLINEGEFPTGSTANFRIQIDANSTTATGNFKLEIAAIKQSNADPQICAHDFNSCCRIAVDTAEYDPELLATAVIPAFDFTLIPNPANEHVTIKFNNTLDEFAIIELLDGFGKTKSTSKAKGSAATLNLSNLPSGLYAVRVLSKGKYVTKKLVLVK
jgi:hypothetical protein